MVNIENIQNEILNALKPLHLDKVILFGSYAYGTPHKNSDIDLYIVTNDEYIPQSYKEKRALVWKVSQKILDIRKRYAIDLLVHTKKMHEKFIELQSSFSKEILEKGRVLLWKPTLEDAQEFHELANDIYDYIKNKIEV